MDIWYLYLTIYFAQHVSLRKRLLPKDGKADITTASSSKSRLSSEGVNINYNEKTLYGCKFFLLLVLCYLTMHVLRIFISSGSAMHPVYS